MVGPVADNGQERRACDWSPDFARETKPRTVDDFRRAAQSFKGSASTIGGWHPGQLAGVNDELTLILTKIMWVAEVSGHWPEQETSVVVKMLPKPAGGHWPSCCSGHCSVQSEKTGRGK